MSCESSKLDIAYLKSVYKNYGNENFIVETVRFISTTENVENLTSGFVPDVYNGYVKDQTPLIELEKLSDSVQLVTGLENIYALPYGSKFRPIDRIDHLKNVNHAIITNIDFVAYDTSVESSTNQDATANSALVTSQALTLGSYATSGVFSALPATWLNNFFRPSVWVNENNIMNFQNTQFGTNYQHRADKSIGLPLPNSQELYLYFADGIRNINVSGICGQLIKSGADTYLKRYPVVATIKITYVKS